MEPVMEIARVIGSAVATAKAERLSGRTLLVVAPADINGEVAGTPYVATDTVGAGAGEIVLVTRGSAADAAVPGDTRSPIDAVVVAIVDRLDVDGDPSYVKH
jgi:ethanolamine utilization protein EutN